ncbi:uncharacterized protein V1518DRAFT_416862 [Limtongia smithiae]|uniref:uncharacterized protein n=1 Tax=Limtongia smithiae TaxID=1125753 RepID=UPI0034CF26D1
MNNRSVLRKMSPDERSAILQHEYPDLDGALVAALAYENDSFDDARAQCQMLCIEAVADYADQNDAEKQERKTAAIRPLGATATWSDFDELLSSSDSLDHATTTTWDTDSLLSDEYVLTAPDRRTPAQKLDFLMSSFPTLQKTDLSRILKACAFDLTRAIDDVLSFLYIDEMKDESDTSTTTSTKIREPDWSAIESKSKRKGRKRNRNLLSSPSRVSPSGQESSTDYSEDMWSLSKILAIPVGRLSALCRRNSHAPVLMIIRLLDARVSDMKRSIVAWGGVLDEENSRSGKQLQRLIPSIPLSLCLKLAFVCQNDVEKATELSIILLEKSCQSGEDIEILCLEETLQNQMQSFRGPSNENNDFVLVSRNARNAKLTVPVSHRPNISLASAQAALIEKTRSRDMAVQNAKDTWSRRKTKAMHSAVAGYYGSEVSRFNKDIRELRLDIARIRVDESATSSSIDLHGIELYEAKTIALEYVNDWWSRRLSGDRTSASAGFRIVTGRGVHSPNGVPRLLPYISQALAAQGWRIELQRGCIVVKGM